jgi:hypothetical protein
MKSGSLVTYKCYKNIEKINDIGVVLEIQQNLILKESIGFDYENLLRIHWFTDKTHDTVPAFRTDYYSRKWYLSTEIYILNMETVHGNIQRR